MTITSGSLANTSIDISKLAEAQNAHKEYNLVMLACLKRGQTQFNELNKMADLAIINDADLMHYSLFNQTFQKAHQDCLECKEKLEALTNKIINNQN